MMSLCKDLSETGRHCEEELLTKCLKQFVETLFIAQWKARWTSNPDVACSKSAEDERLEIAYQPRKQ